MLDEDIGEIIKQALGDQIKSAAGLVWDSLLMDDIEIEIEFRGKILNIDMSITEQEEEENDE